MNKQLYVRPPFFGAVVRCPLTGQPLPPEGAWVEKSPHWLRQIKMGEVLQGEAPKEQAKTAQGKPKAEAQKE